MSELCADNFAGSDDASLSGRAATGGTWSSEGTPLQISDANRCRSYTFQFAAGTLSPTVTHTGNTLKVAWNARWMDTETDTWFWLWAPNSAASPTDAYGVEMRNLANDSTNRIRLFKYDQTQQIGSDVTFNPSSGVNYAFEFTAAYNPGTSEMTLTLKRDGSTILGPEVRNATADSLAAIARHVRIQINVESGYGSRNTTGLHIDDLVLDDGVAADPALDVTTQPSSTASGYVMSPAPVVRATTDGETTDTAFTGNISVAIVGSGGVLVGTTTVAAVAGVATFSALRPCVAGTCTLRFTAGGYTLADSSPFTVTTAGGGAGPIIIGGSMQQSPPIRRNEGTAALRRGYLYIQDENGDPWEGSVTGVKAKISQNGVETGDSPADIVRIGAGFHYVEYAQPYTDIAEGSALAARVEADTGRREAVAVSPIIPGDSYAAAVSQTGLVNAIIRAANGADGYITRKNIALSRIELVIPDVGTLNIPATFDEASVPVDAIGE